MNSFTVALDSCTLYLPHAVCLHAHAQLLRAINLHLLNHTLDPITSAEIAQELEALGYKSSTAPNGELMWHSLGLRSDRDDPVEMIDDEEMLVVRSAA